MLSLLVERSWYERAWLTERAPSRAAQIGRRARLLARRLARATSAVATLLSSRLQQARELSPSIR